VGADAELLVFDYERYRRSVVPRLVELVGGAGTTPWLTGVDERLGEFFGEEWLELAATLQKQPVDLARHCTWLGDDLRPAGPVTAARRNGDDGRLLRDLRDKLVGAEPAPVPPSGPQQARCSSGTCPERSHCLLHEQAGPHAPEMLRWLFEAVTTECCLGERRFLGRNATLHDFRPVLHELGAAPDDQVLVLLDALGGRGAALGHTDIGPAGVHGWLTPAETPVLAGRLNRLDLPVIGTTDKAMSQAHGANLRGEGAPWRHLTLSYVRVMAHRAAAAGHGLLFGHDVSP
jgi:hypothetical protein